MHLLPLAVAVLFLALFFSLRFTGASGKRLACSNPRRHEDVVSHRRWRRISVVLLIASLSLTEPMVRMHGGLVDTIGFRFHLFFAFVFASLFASLFFMTGKKAQWEHEIIARFCIFSFVIAFILAIPLLSRF